MLQSVPCRIYGELRVRYGFICEKCRVCSAGSESATIAVDCDDLKQVKIPSAPSRCMPIGWCSNLEGGKIVFHCPKCH